MGKKSAKSGYKIAMTVESEVKAPDSAREMALYRQMMLTLARRLMRCDSKLVSSNSTRLFAISRAASAAKALMDSQEMQLEIAKIKAQLERMGSSADAGQATEADFK